MIRIKNNLLTVIDVMRLFSTQIVQKYFRRSECIKRTPSQPYPFVTIKFLPSFCCLRFTLLKITPSIPQFWSLTKLSAIFKIKNNVFTKINEIFKPIGRITLQKHGPQKKVVGIPSKKQLELRQLITESEGMFGMSFGEHKFRG